MNFGRFIFPLSSDLKLNLFTLALTLLVLIIKNNKNY